MAIEVVIANRIVHLILTLQEPKTLVKKLGLVEV